MQSSSVEQRKNPKAIIRDYKSTRNFLELNGKKETASAKWLKPRGS